jgi:small conductance mechanosensitive channel
LQLDSGSDLEAADAALLAAAAQLQADPALKDAVIEAPQVLQWNNMTDWGVQVRLMVKTQPGQQWAVGRALRRYAVEALQAAGVRLARPVAVGVGQG